jgi:hypothetical protein
VTIDGVTMTRDTDPATATTGSGPGGSGPATKRFVDANITITPPEATNTVGDLHTFTVTVQQDDGLPAGTPGDGTTGLGPPPPFTQVTVTLTNDTTSNYVTIDDSCVGLLEGTDANGQCFVVFTSPTAGTVTGNASVTLFVGGESLTRDTDPETEPTAGPGGSGPAIKHFVAGSIAWTKVDNAGRLQGGATFELCRTHSFNLEAEGVEDPFVLLEDENGDPAPECLTVVDDDGTDPEYDGNDEDAAAGKFLVSVLPLGRYTVRETVAPPGYEADPDTETVELTPNVGEENNTDQTIEEAFVNSRPVLKITGFSYTNEAVDPEDQPDGILKGSTTYTVTLHNYGTAAANLTNSSLLVSDNAACVGGNTLDLSGETIAAEDGILSDDDSAEFTLTCTYDHPDPTLIEAALNVRYTTNGLERTASGSEAKITFTVAAD